jgi:hypothetical protein
VFLILLLTVRLRLRHSQLLWLLQLLLQLLQLLLLLLLLRLEWTRLF